MGNLNSKQKIKIMANPMFSSTSLSVASQLAESQWSFMLTRPQRLLRTSELSVPVRKEWANQESHFIIRDPHSIELLLNSWHKVVISPLETELEVSPSTE